MWIKDQLVWLCFTNCASCSTRCSTLGNWKQFGNSNSVVCYWRWTNYRIFATTDCTYSWSSMTHTYLYSNCLTIHNYIYLFVEILLIGRHESYERNKIKPYPWSIRWLVFQSEILLWYQSIDTWSLF